jgi:surface antigen
LWLLSLANCVSGDAQIVPEPLYERLGPAGVDTAYHKVQEVLETGRSREAYRWRDAADDSSGTITPLRTFRIASGAYCREFHEAVVIDGTTHSDLRVACRDDLGIWRKVLE